MRFRLRTLMIVLAIGPMVLAWWGWPVLDRIMHQTPEVTFEPPDAPPGDLEDLLGVPVTAVNVALDL